MNEYTENVAFIDLAAQQAGIRDKIDAAIKRVLDHGQYIMGPEVKNFEAELCRFTGAAHALGCANGTDALTLVLMAWQVGPGDAVFVPSFTYVATAEAPAQLGATPFFVDVDEHTFNLDSASLERAIDEARAASLTPKVVIPVDLFGQPADIDPICDIAQAAGMKVLVDGAQGFGGVYKGRRVGSLGDATTTSFFPAKPLGCYGDGGAVLTNDEELAHLVDSLRLHGKGNMKYDNVRIGVNSRLDTLQAAILLEKISIFPAELEKRHKIAQTYTQSLSNHYQTPFVIDGATSAWAQYTLKVDDRDAVQDKLKAANIPSVVYYPMALSQQAGYGHFPKLLQGVPVSESLSGCVLSLPMHPYLDAYSQERIIEALCS